MKRPAHHKAGDGLHYITDNFQVFQDGTFQLGENSTVCVLLNAQRVCAHLGCGNLWELWSQAYKDDPLSQDDAEYMFSQAMPFTKAFNPADARQCNLAIRDLVDVGYPELASLIQAQRVAGR